MGADAAARIMRVYIAGPIADQIDPRAVFAEAQDYITGQGHIAMNPFDIKPYQHAGPCPDGGYAPGEGGRDHTSICCFMRADLAVLLVCDAIYMLRGWEDSRGARVERAVAEAIGLPTYGTMKEQGRVASIPVAVWTWHGIPQSSAVSDSGGGGMTKLTQFAEAQAEIRRLRMVEANYEAYKVAAMARDQRNAELLAALRRELEMVRTERDSQKRDAS